MKKSLILAGMLCIGYANAQYDGKVGINTETPSATLEITPSTDNAKADAKTNEGIIAPKLSKVRIANIETPIEGTLVYATDNTYTGTNTKVAKITEKGYYFYNGAEWVKVQYQDTNDAEWVYDASTKRINLKRSGQTTGFVNKVYYDTQTGNFINSDTDVPSTTNSKIYTSIKSANLGKTNILWGDKKVYSNQNVVIDGTDTTLGTGEFRQNIDYTTIADGAANTGLIMNRTNYVRKLDANRTSQIFTTGNYVEATKGTVGELYALFNKADIGGSVNVNQGGAIKNYNYINVKDGGSIKSLYSINNETSILKGGNIEWLVGQTNLFQFLNGGSSTIKNLVGFEMSTPIYGNHQLSVENAYGLIIPDLRIGTNSNYSIYTGVGKVRVGDLSDTTATGDRQVVVDADGVLKVGTATATPAVEVGSTKSMKCDATNRGKMNFVPNDNGSDVFGICLRNKDGNYYWGLLTGGGNLTTGGATFFGE